MYHLLTDKQIESNMKGLDGWVAKDKALSKHFRFEGYMDALKFVETVAVDAESRDHYPDVLFKYLEVVIVLSSHDAKESLKWTSFQPGRSINWRRISAPVRLSSSGTHGIRPPCRKQRKVCPPPNSLVYLALPPGWLHTPRRLPVTPALLDLTLP